MDSTELLQKLVTVNTSNPPGNEDSLIDTILDVARPAKEQYKIIPVAQGRSDLLLEIKGKPGSVIGFAGHLDTVPAGDESRWKYPPFSGKTEGGYLFGRGASDMRGGLAAMLMLFRHYAGNGIVPPATLRFLFTADEESGGAGISILRDGRFLDDLSQLFICEPTDCLPGIAEKGAVWVEITVEGKTSHAAIPEKGINALEYGISFMERLKKKIESLPAHPLLGSCTCSITRAVSGIKTNTVPDYAELSADIRTGPGIGSDKVFRIVNEEAERITSSSSVKLKVNFTNNREALEVSLDSHMLRKLRKVYANLDLQFEPVGIQFYTDASLVIPYLHTPFVILGPGKQAECHSTDEKVEISMVEKAFLIYRSFLDTLS